MNTCSVPSNDADLEGIYRYLCWEAANSGLPSPCFHYLEVLYKAAKLGTEAFDILKEIDRVGAFYPSAIEIDIYENGDGDEIGEDINKLLRMAK